MIKIERDTEAFRVLQQMFADPNTTAITIAHRLTRDETVAQVLAKADHTFALGPAHGGMWTPPMDATYTRHEVWDR